MTNNTAQISRPVYRLACVETSHVDVYNLPIARIERALGLTATIELVDGDVSTVLRDQHGRVQYVSE